MYVPAYEYLHTYTSDEPYMPVEWCSPKRRTYMYLGWNVPTILHLYV